MAASSIYPIVGSLIRGDPICIQVDLAQDINGVKTPIDASAMTFWAQIRRSADAPVVTEFAIDAVVPPGGTVASRLLLTLTPDQSRLLRTGMAFDLEEIQDAATPTSIRTWWQVTRLVVQKDVSHA